MLVCPSCREENLEDARFCRVCGRSLEPVAGYARRLERPEDEEDLFDMPTPRRARPWLAAAALVVVALGVAGWGIVAASSPDPCSGRYSSAVFPYCTRIPQGWQGSPDLDGAEVVDRFVRTADGESPQAVAEVRVEDVLDPSVQTQQYAQQYRVSQVQDGIDPGTPSVVTIDGEEAIAWSYTVESEQGPPLHVRDVLLIRPEGAWLIELIAADEVQLEARVAFERLLEGWRWKS